MHKDVKERELGPDGYVIATPDDYWEAVRDYVAGGPMLSYGDRWQHIDDCERGMNLLAEIEWLEHTAIAMGFNQQRLHNDLNEEMKKQGRNRELPSLPKLPQREKWYSTADEIKELG